MAEVTYKTFINETRDRFEDLKDRYDQAKDDHTAFSFLVAELFETPSSAGFCFTDGKRDGGVDFLISDAPSFSIYQCKCPELDVLENADKPETFDAQPLEELCAAIDMILDPSGTYDVKHQVEQFRSDYHLELENQDQDGDAPQLFATLAVFGKLTDSAMTAFNSRREELRKKNVHLKLIQWTDLRDQLYASQDISQVNISIDLDVSDPEKLTMRANDFCIALVPACAFVDAFRKYEWSLFEWNVRLQVRNSPVNKKIITTLMHESRRKKFHHYNNGLLITCAQYEYKNQGYKIRLKGPQIINGCQTVRSLCEAYDGLPPDDKKKFREQVLVQVKLIKAVDEEFIGDLVISTNDQNPMNPRNLKSNTLEQKQFQKQFRELHGWFYQRKDGEYESLKVHHAKTRWFRKSDYKEMGGRERVIDNSDVAQAWLALIGNSNRALRGGIDYFGQNSDQDYQLVFRKAPSKEFWDEFSKPLFTWKAELADEAAFPSSYQYLVAYLISRYVKHRKISYQRNLEGALCRGIESGALDGEVVGGKAKLISDFRTRDEYLADDSDYNIGILLNNMSDVLIELFAFVLVQRYAALEASQCKALLSDEYTVELLKAGIPSAMVIQDKQSQWWRIYEFLKYTVMQYYLGHVIELRAQPRMKSYLAQRKVINNMREMVLRVDKTSAKITVEDWSTDDDTNFISSLRAIE